MNQRADLLRDAKILVVGIVAGLLLAGGMCVWLKFKPSLPSVLAPPSKELAKEETKRLDCKPVLVYRDKVEKKLDLPDIVTKDPDKHVVASSPVPPSDYPHTMTAVYDEKVGNVNMFLRQDKLPWLAFNRRWRFGGYYGVNDRESGVVLGSASYEFLQLKRLNVTATGQVDTSSRWFIGVGVTF